MIDVSLAHGRSQSLPKCPYPVLQRIKGTWFVFIAKKRLHTPPHVLDWIHVRRFWGSFPPIDVELLQLGLCIPATVFGVVILLEPVTLWIGSLNKRNQPSLQDLYVSCRNHNSRENHKWCCTPRRYPPPPHT